MYSVPMLELWALNECKRSVGTPLNVWHRLGCLSWARLLKNCKYFISYIYITALKFISFRRFRTQNVDQRGPEAADIEAASQFLIRMGAGIGFTESFYGMVLDNIVDWIEVRLGYHHPKESDTKQLRETEAS